MIPLPVVTFVLGGVVALLALVPLVVTHPQFRGVSPFEAARGMMCVWLAACALFMAIVGGVFAILRVAVP